MTYMIDFFAILGGAGVLVVAAALWVAKRPRTDEQRANAAALQRYDDYLTGRLARLQHPGDRPTAKDQKRSEAVTPVHV